MEAAGAARTASPAMAERIERDAITDLKAIHPNAEFDNFAGGLVPEDERDARDHPVRTEFPIDDMQIGTANAASADADEELAFADFRNRGVNHFGAGRRTGLRDCFHFFVSLSLQYVVDAFGVNAREG